MEIYYTYDTESRVSEIIAAIDGRAICLDEIPLCEHDDDLIEKIREHDEVLAEVLSELEPVEYIKDIIHDGLRNGRWQDYWDDFEDFGEFFPPSEILIRYPNAVKYIDNTSINP